MSTIVRRIQGTHASKTDGQINTGLVTFGEIEYYLDQAPAEIISFRASHPWEWLFSSCQGDILPCTVIDWSTDQLKKADLDAISTDIALRDDVWTPAFLEGETSCHHEIAIMTTNNMTPVDSRHTPNTPDFADICCARWDQCFPRIRIYSFADWSLCNPAINWRNPSCVAVVRR